MRTNYVRKWLMAAGLLMAAVSANAYDFEVDGFYYNIISKMKKTVELASNEHETQYSGDIVIPGTVAFEGDEYSVIGIGDYTFYDSWGSNITSVVLPEGITYIGEGAFKACWQMVSITLPEGLISIGKDAFNNCGRLSSISIPESIETIGDDAFYRCGLTSFSWPKNITSIGEGMFCECSSLSSVNIPEGVTTIGKAAFRGCRTLTNVKFPKTLITIGSGAFYGCYSSLTSVTIPENVTSIGEEAFCNCNLKSVFCYPVVPPTLGRNAFGYNQEDWFSITLEVQDEVIKTYAWTEPWSYFNILGYDGVRAGEKYVEGELEYTFVSEDEMTVSVGLKSRSQVESIVVPDKIVYKDKEWTVAAVTDEGFKPSYFLKSVTLPNSIKKIGKSAFCGWIGYYDGNYEFNINIPWENLERIESSAFCDCPLPNKIEFSEKLTFIGDDAFFCSQDLESVVLPASLKKIGIMAFYNCKNLKSVTCKAKTVPTLVDYYYNDNNEIEYGYDYNGRYHNAFVDIPSDAILTVPEESIEAYKVWNFKNINSLATEITIGSTGYATMFISDSDVKIPYGVTVYTGVVNNEWLTLSWVYDKIPAGTPVILEGEEGKYNFIHTSEAKAVGDNDLKASTEDVIADGSQYVLAEKDGTIGFFKAEGTIPAGKAYLEIANAGVKGFRFNTETGIETIDNGQLKIDNSEIYDLSGRRVEKATKGIYIINGKKVLM